MERESWSSVRLLCPSEPWPPDAVVVGKSGVIWRTPGTLLLREGCRLCGGAREGLGCSGKRVTT